MREITEQKNYANRRNNATGEWKKKKGETNSETKKER